MVDKSSLVEIAGFLISKMVSCFLIVYMVSSIVCHIVWALADYFLVSASCSSLDFGCDLYLYSFDYGFLPHGGFISFNMSLADRWFGELVSVARCKLCGDGFDDTIWWLQVETMW